jgi:hypothetical protein
MIRLTLRRCAEAMGQKDEVPDVVGSLVRIERKLDLILEKMGIQVAKNSEGKILATPKQISFIKDLAGQVGVSVNDGELKKLSVEEASAMITDLKIKRAAKWSMK